MDKTIFKVYKNDANYLEAAILTSKSGTKVVTFNGWDTVDEMIAQMKQDYGQDAERVPSRIFQQEIERRTTHTPEMLALLEDTYAGNLQECWVYGSILRPMSGIVIEGATYLNGNGAKYQGWKIHDYVVTPGELEKSVIEHYDLAFVSHP
jgi:hypothetical protein